MSLAPVRPGESTNEYHPSLSMPEINSQSSESKERLALSVAVEIDSNGALDASSLKLCASTIKFPMRLTYREAEEMLEFGLCGENGPDWGLGYLAKAARLRRKWRAKRGVVEHMLPYVSVKASEDPSVPVSVTPSGHSDGGSEVLVTEIMLLAGEAVGLFGKQNNLPLPYRTQLAPSRGELPANLNQILETLGGSDAIYSDLPGKFSTEDGQKGHPWCRNAYMRKFLKRVALKSSPGPHWGLGLDHYVQWTSPLRRHNDLVVHWQLKAWLLQQQDNKALTPPVQMEQRDQEVSVTFNENKTPGKGARSPQGSFPVKTHEEMVAFMTDRGIITRRAATVQRGGDSYWIYEFLRQSMRKGRVFEAVVIGPDRPSYETDWRVVLLELGVELPFSSLGIGADGSSQRVENGENLYLRVEACEPRTQKITLRRVDEKPPPSAGPPTSLSSLFV
mmetsp:Transcript_58713/g.117935  ORF Transcript_58713/g.117935 Transcript_58713/m.117935 type:complete len:448 (-) Transcript_58713:114-1457(-)